MRGFRSLLVFIVVLAGLGAYIYFVESKKPAGSDSETKAKVFSVESDKIEEIDVRSVSGEQTTLKKADGKWRVVAPVTAEADEAEVAGITSNLASLEVQRVVDENASNLDDFGLTKPRVEIAFRPTGAKEPRRLLIGAKTATGVDLYAKVADEKRVILISGFLEDTFNRTTFDLREKSALTFDRDKADSIELVTPDHTVKLAKSGTEWRVATPTASRADYGTVEGLIGRINTAQMKSLITTPNQSVDPKQYGLDKPTVSARIAAGSAQATLTIGKDAGDGKFYAKDESRPLIFTVESSLVDELKKGPGEYRRKDVFEFRPFNATRLQIVRGGQTTVFDKVKEKETEKWRQTAPAAMDVDSGKMDSLLSALSNLRAQSFVDAASGTGLDKPELTVHVWYEDGKKQERVTFGKSGADAYASRPDEPGAGKLMSSDLDSVTNALQEAVKKEEPKKDEKK